MVDISISKQFPQTYHVTTWIQTPKRAAFRFKRPHLSIKPFDEHVHCQYLATLSQNVIFSQSSFKETCIFLSGTNIIFAPSSPFVGSRLTEFNEAIKYVWGNCFGNDPILYAIMILNFHYFAAINKCTVFVLFTIFTTHR